MISDATTATDISDALIAFARARAKAIAAMADTITFPEASDDAIREGLSLAMPTFNELGFLLNL